MAWGRLNVILLYVYGTGHFLVLNGCGYHLSHVPKSFSLNLTLPEQRRKRKREREKKQSLWESTFCAYSFVLLTNFRRLRLYVIFNCPSLGRFCSISVSVSSNFHGWPLSISIYVFFGCAIAKTIRTDDGKNGNGLHEQITATCSHLDRWGQSANVGKPSSRVIITTTTLHRIFSLNTWMFSIYAVKCFE